MSDEMVEGVMFRIGSTVFFIARDDLRGFRVPEDAAEEIRTRLEQRSPEVPDDMGVVVGVRFSRSGPLEFSSILAHGLTASRVC